MCQRNDNASRSWSPPLSELGERWDTTVVPLRTHRVGRPLFHFDTVASTMPLADAYARLGAPDGTGILADEQTAGRGRRGRPWNAPRGSALLCSLICRLALPPERLFYLNAAIGLGLARGVEQLTGLLVQMKWPNDLLIAGKKVAGVLSTTRLRDSSLEYAVVGFGLNVNLQSGDLPEVAEGALLPTSLGLETGGYVDRKDLLRHVLLAIDEYYDLLWRKQFATVWEAWTARLAGRGELVRIVTNSHQLRSGTLWGVDADGALLLQTPEGMERHLAGDVLIGPRRDIGA